MWDEISQMFLLGSLSGIAVLGDVIREYLPVNLILTFGFINVGIMLLKMYFRKKFEEKSLYADNHYDQENTKADKHSSRTVYYRLCGCASGVLIAVIWNCSMSIRHSLLHFGQKSGKFVTGSFSQILSRVLFPQTGKRTHSTLTFICVSTFYFFLEYPITLTKYDATTIPKTKIAINIGFFTKF